MGPGPWRGLGPRQGQQAMGLGRLRGLGGHGIGKGNVYRYIYIYIPGAASRCLLGPRLLSQPVPGTPERAETVDGGLVSSGKQHQEHNGTAKCTHEQ